MDTKRITGGPAINPGIDSDRVNKAEKQDKTGGLDGHNLKNPSDFAVSLSEKAQEIMEARNKAMHIAKSTSPIREDRVQDLRERIKNGTYEINPGDIADGIMKEAIKDELSKNPEA